MRKILQCKKFVLLITVVLLLSTVMYAQSDMSRGSQKTALSLYEDGIICQQKKDFFGAVDCFTESLLLNKDFGDAWFHLAQCTYELGEFDLTVTYTDNAEKYFKDYSEIRNLRGMAYISLGKLDDARKVFDGVLTKFPNDVESRFGLAQLDLFDGSLSSAQKTYLDALKRQNTNRKALLSLALISAEMGKNDAAIQYIDQALEFHSGEPQVHYLASYLAAKRGDWPEAERRARSAVQLKGDYDKAYELLATILYNVKRYSEVIDICDFRIRRNRNLSEAWFLKGLSLQRMDRLPEAIDIYTTGLTIDPQNEIMRSALEQLIEENVPVEDPRRAKWAEYHINKAFEHKRNYYGPGERYEYQQALKIDPLNKIARQAFADLLNREGFYELYLSQLNFIKENSDTELINTNLPVQKDENTPSIKMTPQDLKNSDTAEALNSLMTNTLSRKWKINPFYLDKTRFKIGIYFKTQTIQLSHPDVEQITAIAAKKIFSGVPSTAVTVQTMPVNGFGEAFRDSRTVGNDYFVIMKIDETDRSFSLDADVYSSRTGTLATKLHIYRTGNDRFANCLRRFRQSILEILPIRGKVINHTGSTLLIDLGKSDGVIKGSEFDVVVKDSIYTSDKGTGVSYPESSILGTFKIDIVNEEISEGTFTKKGFYDKLNNNDELVLTKLNPDENTTQGIQSTPQETKPGADNKGQPVTSKEVDKPLSQESYQETTLISMIREID